MYLLLFDKFRLIALASRILKYFILNASLVRPMSENGKLKLAADLAQFEFALAPIFSGTQLSISSCGPPYEALKSFKFFYFILFYFILFYFILFYFILFYFIFFFLVKFSRRLIFLETNQVTAYHHRSDLPLIYVIHHLIVRASTELQLPHVRAGWHISQYAQWLETHTEKEIYEFVTRCLDAYAADVHKRGGKLYTPEYPLIKKMIQSEME